MDKRTRETLGVDLDGRLHGSVGIRLLTEAAQAALPTQHNNKWLAADVAVAEQKDPEVTEAALRHLLALHLHDLDHIHPQVAMRNVRVGDVVLLHGSPLRVDGILNADKKAITLVTTLGNWAYDRDVNIPLVSRPAQ